MTLFECYEKRRGALYSRLTQAKSLADGSAALSDALDAILYDYSSDCADDELRELAAEMASAVKTAFPLLECASDAKVWQSSSGGERIRAKKWPAVMCLIFGALTLAGTIFIFFSQHPTWRVDEWGGWAAALALGALLLFFAGLFFTRTPKIVSEEKTEQKVDIRLDADDASRRLAAVALQMDKNLDARASELAAKKADARAQGLPVDELELMTTLLEGAYSDSGEIALESLEDVGHYLRRRGIETLEFDGGDEHYFELLPGEKTATLRPALLCDGRLIKKGLATYAEEDAR